MDRLQNYLKRLDPAYAVTDEEIQCSVSLLQTYAPILNRSVNCVADLEDRCNLLRRQSLAQFIDLAIDFDHDEDRKRIVERLSAISHSLELLSAMDKALVLVQTGHARGNQYFRILQARYFDACCYTNEQAYQSLCISPSTYYRNIRPAVRAFAACLWHVVIPDMIIAEKRNNSTRENTKEASLETPLESEERQRTFPDETSSAGNDRKLTEK